MFKKEFGRHGWDAGPLQGHAASSVYSPIKDSQIQTKTRCRRERIIQMSRDTGCLWKRASCDEDRKGMSRSVHAAVRGSSRWKWDAASRHHPHTLSPPAPHTQTLSSQLLRASPYVTLIVFATYAKYLLFPGTFYRQALVPQLLFVSVQGMKKKKKRSVLPSAASAPLFLLPAVAVGLPQWDKFTHSLRGWKKNVCALEMRTQNWHKEPLIRNKIIPVWWLRKTL